MFSMFIFVNCTLSVLTLTLLIRSTIEMKSFRPRVEQSITNSSFLLEWCYKSHTRKLFRFLPSQTSKSIIE